MTLVVALAVADGVVVGADTQLTRGMLKTRTTKIRDLNAHAVWAAAGELAMIQRVADALVAADGLEGPLSQIRDLVAVCVRSSLEAIVDLDYRARFVSDPEVLADLHPADFLFVEFRDQPRLLHMTTLGVGEWFGPSACLGRGAPLAHAALDRYARAGLSLAAAKLAVYRALDDCIQTGACGAGGPVDLFVLDVDGPRAVPAAEVQALADANELLRAAELELLISESRAR